MLCLCNLLHAHERFDFVCDVFSLFEGHVLVNGDAEALFAHDFGDGQGAFSIGIHRVRGVEVERDWIKDCRADSFFFEVFH